MYANENPSGSFDNGSDVSSNGLDYVDMENDGENLQEEQIEENESNESSESNSESQEENNTIDYTDILISIDGRLENVESSLSNLETGQLDIVNNTENTSFLVGNFEEGFTIFTIVILVSVVCFAIYHWLDNFIK